MAPLPNAPDVEAAESAATVQFCPFSTSVGPKRRASADRRQRAAQEKLVPEAVCERRADLGVIEALI